ncbi:MAG: N-acyl-D-aspartate/D-glutamate deacylase [Congregibacter sp.]
MRLAREHDIPFMHVIAAMSYRPAKHLGDTGLAAMQERMIADITIFDPQTVTDNATYTHDSRPSTGIDFVLVSGQVTVDAGRVRDDVFAGRPIRFLPEAPRRTTTAK